MVSGFRTRADGISLYTNSLCDYLECIGVSIERLNVSKERNPPLPRERLVHIQFGMQFFRGKFGMGMILYLIRLRARGTKVVVTFHDVPIEAYPIRSLSFFRSRNRIARMISWFARLGKLLFDTIRVYIVLLSTVFFAHRIIVHTRASRSAFLNCAVVIPLGSEPPSGATIVPTDGTPLILTFGVIHGARRVDFVMRELSSLPVYYVVAGANTDSTFLSFLASHKPTNAEVVLAHPVSSLDRLIRSSWAVVIPPSVAKPEHASAVLHVASSFGKPVISPPVGDVVDFPNSFLTYTDGPSLRNRIAEIVGDRNLRADYTNRALAFAQNTSFPEIARKHVELYSELIRHG